MDAPAWLLECISAWKPRERLGGAAWAEAERVLSKAESPEKIGKWKCVPWQREILDALASPRLEWIVIKKGAQMGVSELVRCAIGRWALLDPGDVLWVMETQDKAEKAMRKLRAMFEATPTLRSLVSPRRSDSTLLEMVLTNGMKVVIGWATSAASLSSDPFRRVILDEAAKYKWSVQGESNPVDFSKERTKVYGQRGLIVLLSSPKHNDDIICTNYDHVLDRRVFGVPCPSCSMVQPTDFLRVRWPDGDPDHAPSEARARARLADEIERDQSAWLECRVCKGKIQPHQAQWQEGAGWIDDQGAERGGRRVAFHVSEFVHWKTTLSHLVGKWLRCTTPSAIQGFWNGSLGLTWMGSSEIAIESALFAARAVHAPGVVPPWATKVIATADTQLRGWWYMVRAWSQDGRSRLLSWGWAETEADLVVKTISARFPIEGRPDFVARAIALAVDTGGGMLTPDGSRTKEVYKLVQRYAPLTIAIKGEGDRDVDQAPYRESVVKVGDERYGETVSDLTLNLVNKSYYADAAAALIRANAPVLWEECRGAEAPAYGRQMASEHRVFQQTTKESRWLWVKRTSGAENHMWDLARYQCFAADKRRAEVLLVWPKSEEQGGNDEERERPRGEWKIGRR